MSTREIVDAILSNKSSDAQDLIVQELNTRMTAFTSEYKQAAMADYFGGTVVKEEKDEDGEEVEKESDKQKEGKGDPKDKFDKKDKEGKEDDSEDDEDKEEDEDEDEDEE